MNKKLKLGIVGLGNMGSAHVKTLMEMDNVELVGVCDIVKEKADHFAGMAHTTPYYDCMDMLEKSGLEALQIAVPHYDHTTYSVEAFKRGLHVLCEKPLAVHINDALLSNRAYEEALQKNPNLVFGIMFQERTLHHYKKIKELITNGILGRLTRVTWIDTTRFRSQVYYNSGGWRATWAGEGGGILTNQCPHTLDMYQWLFGVPKTISAYAAIGKYHDIEVEDEVSACLIHENGMIGNLIVTTAEAPGTNRLEIVGENGKLVYEQNELTFWKNDISMLKLIEVSEKPFEQISCHAENISFASEEPTEHKVVLDRFVRRALGEDIALIADGREGLHSVGIANGIMMSHFKQCPVEIASCGDEFEAKLKELIANSKFVKQVNENVTVNMEDSFAK